MGLALPLAWYAMLCAATTWLSRSYGAVLGFAWPVAIFIGVLDARSSRATPSRLFVHDVAWVLSRLDPADATCSCAARTRRHRSTMRDSNFELRLSIEVLFFVVYGALAVWQWQRVEA